MGSWVPVRWEDGQKVGRFLQGFPEELLEGFLKDTEPRESRVV